MKKIVVMIILSFEFPAAKAQINLVPNFSFEQYDTCPNMEDQIHYATGWSKYSSNSNPTNTTPDYYNACSADTLFGVPKSIFCYQPEHRYCNAYIGLVTIQNITWQNYREHVGIQLSQPLIIGQKYFISFYTVFDGLEYQGTYYGSPSNNIGIRLSMIPYNGNNPAPIDNFAHLRSIPIISDSVNWQRISGSIIADSAYQYLIVGNFFDASNTDTANYNCSSCLNAHGYYLVDDICLSTDSLLCNLGIDTLPCLTSANETDLKKHIRIYPNPVSDFITISLEGNHYEEVILFDILGRVIFSEVIEVNSIINLSQFQSGTYILKLISKTYSNCLINKIIKL